MTKQLLTAVLAGSMALGAFAESSVEFTYADDNFVSWGKAKKESIDVAIRIDNPALAGKKITSVRALVNDGEGVKPLSLWLSSELTLESKVNAPDICSMEPTVSKVNLTEKWVANKMEASLATPYVLTDAPVYVGYSIEVTATDTEYDKYPIVLSEASNPDGFWLHASKSVLKWKDYTSTVDAVAAIYVTIEGDFEPYSVGILDIPYTYVTLDESFKVPVTLMNVGSETVKSIDFSYSIGDLTKTGHLNLQQPLVPNLVYSTIIDFPLDAIDECGEYDVTLTIDRLNGKDNVSEVAGRTFSANVLPFVPVHTPLLEEYTGLKCGYCPRGFASLEYIKENYPEFVAVAYHTRSYGDPMDCTNTFPSSVPGFPYAWLNRTYSGDPYYGTYTCAWDKYRMVDELVAQSKIMTPWDMSISQTWDSESILTANISVRCLNPIENGKYKIGYVLVQNGMTDPEWGQSNYFAGNNPANFEIPQMEQFCTGPSTVYGLVFNDVVVYSGQCRGVSNSIPSELPALETVELSCTFDMNNVKNYLGTSLVQNTDDMYVVAFVLDGNGKVMNCVKTMTNNEIAGVQNVSSNDSDAPVEYYNLNGIKVANPENGIFIRRQGNKTTKVIL